MFLFLALLLSTGGLQADDATVAATRPSTDSLPGVEERTAVPGRSLTLWYTTNLLAELTPCG